MLFKICLTSSADFFSKLVIRSFFAASAITAFIELPFALIFILVIYFINSTIVMVPLVAMLLLLCISIPTKYAIQKVIDSTHEATGRRNGILVEALANLDKMGVEILVCGTCLDHFDLLDRKLVGDTTNMLDIVTAMQLADKVINI